MKYLKVYVYMALLTTATWTSMILTIKLIESVILLVPDSLWRSILGLVLYALWGGLLIAGIKLILSHLSARLAERGKPAP